MILYGRLKKPSVGHIRSAFNPRVSLCFLEIMGWPEVVDVPICAICSRRFLPPDPGDTLTPAQRQTLACVVEYTDGPPRETGSMQSVKQRMWVRHDVAYSTTIDRVRRLAALGLVDLDDTARKSEGWAVTPTDAGRAALETP